MVFCRDLIRNHTSCPAFPNDGSCMAFSSVLELGSRRTTITLRVSLLLSSQSRNQKLRSLASIGGNNESYWIQTYCSRGFRLTIQIKMLKYHACSDVHPRWGRHHAPFYAARGLVNVKSMRASYLRPLHPFQWLGIRSIDTWSSSGFGRYRHPKDSYARRKLGRCTTLQHYFQMDLVYL